MLTNSCAVDSRLREDKLLAQTMGKSIHLVLFAILLTLVSPQAVADPYEGYFTGELDGREYRATIDLFSAGAYDGILLVDGEPMQIDARRHGDFLTGLLRNNTEQFGFRGRLQGSILVMEIEDGRRLVLRRGTPE